MESLEAVILGTIFRNPENGYSVLSVRAGRNECAVVGALPELNPGEQAVFTGSWVEHPSYGRQFKCASCEVRLPTTLLGIERYLAGGAVRGVGPSTARLIVEHFGEETMAILADYPHRLTEIPGIGPKRARMIAESFAEQQGTRQAIIFLQSYGIPAPLAVKISQHYGDRTREVVQRNPYQLCDDLEEKTGAQMIRQVTDAPIVSISAKYGSGMDELAKIVKDMFFSGDVLYNDEIVITNARQKAAIRDALESMKMVRKSIDDKMPEDFLSIDLTAAYQQLGLVTGESVQDDVADRIFSDFCVGK